jgi:hypothetical protein
MLLFGRSTLRCIALPHQPRLLTSRFSTGCHIVDDFTLNGPQSFEGDGIILYEVDASAVPPQALRFMETMMQCLMAVRAKCARVMIGSLPAVPNQPKICGGLIEFRVLSYHHGP